MDLATAFRNFGAAVVHKEPGICAVRERYLTMTPTNVMNEVFHKLRQLYKITADVEAHCEQALQCSRARKKQHDKVLNALTTFTAQLNADDTLRRLMQVSMG